MKDLFYIYVNHRKTGERGFVTGPGRPNGPDRDPSTNIGLAKEFDDRGWRVKVHELDEEWYCTVMKVVYCVPIDQDETVPCPKCGHFAFVSKQHDMGIVVYTCQRLSCNHEWVENIH